MYRQPVYLRIPLGYWLSFFGLLMIGFALYTLSLTNLLWHGVAAQGVITNSEAVACGSTRSHYQGLIYSVRYTDQTGQAHIDTISQCDENYIGLNVSPGDSVAIVYLPDDPTTIAPHASLGQIFYNSLFYLVCTIVFGFITLILLRLWIRKRLRERSP